MNKYLFFVLIKQKGLKIEQVAQKLKISTQALYLRVESKRNFKMKELSELIKILELTGEQLKEIFFSENESKTENT